MALRTLLCLLSLSSMCFADDQDVLQTAQSSLQRTLVTKTITYNRHQPSHVADPSTATSISQDDSSRPCASDEKWCPDSAACILSTHDCCSTAHCYPGDYCFKHGGKDRCCPLGLTCFEIRGVVCIDQPVFWYEELHIVEDDEVTITSMERQESTQEIRTKITVTASYAGEGRLTFSSLSESMIEAAATGSVFLDVVPMPTWTRTAMRMPTAHPRPFLFDGLPGVEGQVVLG